MKEETPWIWNKGIAALCDHRLPDDFPNAVYSYHGNSSRRSQSDFYTKLASKVCKGELVWVKVEWLAFFVRNILPDIETDFILVTGDSDYNLPSGLPHESALLLDSSRVIHWFTQNYDGTPSDKISPLPIGMDFHTIQQKDFWGIKKIPIAKQDEVLEMILQKLEPISKRKKKLYIDCQFSWRSDSMSTGAVNDLTRTELYQLIHTDPAVHLQDEFLPQFEMWLRRGQFAYVLSHHGVGLDCHRTWEALILGHVVIVQKSSLDPLYEDLPVIIVDDWMEVKPSGVNEILNIDIEKKWNRKKLTNHYWIEKMKLISKRAL